METAVSNVRCYSGHSYAQRPVSFTWQEQLHQVSAILSEESTPSGKRFMVKTPVGDLFYLDYYIEHDLWRASRASLPEGLRRNP